jgi:hypothetical protein
VLIVDPIFTGVDTTVPLPDMRSLRSVSTAGGKEWGGESDGVLWLYSDLMWLCDSNIMQRLCNILIWLCDVLLWLSTAVRSGAPVVAERLNILVPERVALRLRRFIRISALSTFDGKKVFTTPMAKINKRWSIVTVGRAAVVRECRSSLAARLK